MRHKADEFEHALEESGRGDLVQDPLASLVRTAHLVRKLSTDLPAPPERLAAGRQRFLAEAARLREARVQRQVRPAWAFRLAAAFGITTILLGILLGAERAAASSLPGEPLYGVKLAGEQLRLALAVGQDARYAYREAMAEERMDEILALLAAGRPIDGSATRRAAELLEQALVAASELPDSSAAQALMALAEMIQQRETAMRAEVGQVTEFLQELLRKMERVREEAHRGEGDPDGLRRRLRFGVPGEPAGAPQGAPATGPEPARTGAGPSPSTAPGPSQTPQSTALSPGSPTASGTPAWTPGPSMVPQPTHQRPSTDTPPPPRASEPAEPPHTSRTPGPGGAGMPNPGGTPNHAPGSAGWGGKP